MGILDLLRGKPRREQFADRVLALLRARGAPSPLDYDRDAYAIRVGDGGMVVNLKHLYGDWSGFAPAERDEALRVALDGLFDKPIDELDLDEAAPLLVPVVRNLADQLALQWEGALRDERLPPPPSIALTSSLVVMLGVDRPSSLAYVNAANLEAWGRSFDELLPRAIENLRNRGEGRFERHRAGFHIAAFEDFSDSARVLTPEVFDRLALPGAPIAIVVARDLLLVAGAEDGEALAAMGAVASQMFTELSRPIGCAPMIFENRAWRAIAHDDDAVPLELRGCSTQQQVRDYAIQSSVLQRFLEKEGRAVVLQDLVGASRADQLVTWCEWEEGPPALLPKADLVVLKPASGDEIVRAWDVVARVCGFVPEADTHPARYIVRAWPGPGQWAQIRAAGDDPREIVLAGNFG